MILNDIEKSINDSQNSFKQYATDFFLLALKIEEWLSKIYKDEFKQKLEFPIQYVKILQHLGLKMSYQDLNYYSNPISNKGYMNFDKKIVEFDYNSSKYELNYSAAYSIVSYLTQKDMNVKDLFIPFLIEDSLKNIVLPALLFPPKLTWNTILSDEIKDKYKISYSKIDFDSFIKYMSIKMSIPRPDVYNSFVYIANIYSCFLPNRIVNGWEFRESIKQKKEFDNMLPSSKSEQIKYYLKKYN